MMRTTKVALQLDEYHWGWVMYFLLVHILGITGVIYAFVYASWPTIIFALGYYFLCHLAITIGGHRLYAHRSFKTFKVVQYVLVLLFSGVMQGPVTWWAGKHRLHHEKSDIPGEDPHTPKDGFLHAHGLWVMKKRGLTVPPDKHLLAFYRPNSEFGPAKWQADHHLVLGIVMAFLLPLAICSLWGDSLGGILVGGFARLLFQYHFTWIVNSIGHYHGETEGHGSATNQRGIWGVFLAIMTVGESNHAGHHSAPAHYRIGRKGGLIDPGAWIIELLSRWKIVWDLKTPGQVLE